MLLALIWSLDRLHQQRDSHHRSRVSWRANC